MISRYGPGFYMRRPTEKPPCDVCGDPFRRITPNQRICGKAACKRELQRQARERHRIRDSAPEVTAQVAIENESGSERVFTIRLWSGLPSWWNTGSAERRRAWLEQHFRRRLPVAAGAKILRVTVVA